jgi:hypothetical protein
MFQQRPRDVTVFLRVVTGFCPVEVVPSSLRRSVIVDEQQRHSQKYSLVVSRVKAKQGTKVRLKVAQNFTPCGPG